MSDPGKEFRTRLIGQLNRSAPADRAMEHPDTKTQKMPFRMGLSSRRGRPEICGEGFVLSDAFSICEGATGVQSSFRQLDSR